MSASCWSGSTRRRALLTLCVVGVLSATSVGLAQKMPRLGPAEALEHTAKYVAYVPDPASDAPAIVAVVLRGPKGNAPHLLRAWQDAADAQGVTLLAPMHLKGTAEQQAEQITDAIAAWEMRNGRKAEYVVAVGFSLSTSMAIQAALEMPDRWAGLALTPAWAIEPPLKARLGTLKGLPVFLLHSQAHFPDSQLAKRAKRDFEAAGCIVHTHTAKYGNNMQTAYHNADTILAWVREITQAKKGRTPTSQPAAP